MQTYGVEVVRDFHNHKKPMFFEQYTVEAVETLPEWPLVYFVKTGDSEMKCNLCDNVLKGDEKSLDILKHMQDEHKDVYSLHKDNPEASVGFRIEFLNLNMLKDDIDPKAHPVILGEVCEATTEPLLIEKDADKADKQGDGETHYVILGGHPPKKQKRMPSITRKRSWVWKYFDKLSNIIYRCKLCNVVLSIKGCNSNNMNRHVRTRHPSIFKTEVSKQVKFGNIQAVLEGEETPYAVKTEEIYASDDRDYEIPIESPTSQKLRRSWIWSYFDRVTGTQAQCKICRRQISHGGNATGNMNRHLKMIHHKTAESFDQSWVWKVFESIDDDFYSCKICQYKCMKYSDMDKCISYILNHLKVEHGVVSGDQIITGTDVEVEDN